MAAGMSALRRAGTRARRGSLNHEPSSRSASAVSAARRSGSTLRDAGAGTVPGHASSYGAIVSSRSSGSSIAYAQYSASSSSGSWSPGYDISPGISSHSSGPPSLPPTSISTGSRPARAAGVPSAVQAPEDAAYSACHSNGSCQGPSSVSSISLPRGGPSPSERPLGSAASVGSGLGRVAMSVTVGAATDNGRRPVT